MSAEQQPTAQPSPTSPSEQPPTTVPSGFPAGASVGREDRRGRLAARANQNWWDSDAARYVSEHAHYLDGFYWCPEMLSEKDARLLGNAAGKRILEVGCGQAACSAWLANELAGTGATVVGFDISRGMLGYAPPSEAVLLQADAQALPFRDNAFDIAFSAFGALPFVPDVQAVMADIHRVLVPGGRWVFSVTHPMRWVFPDDPTALTASYSYFDTEYVETSESGEILYAEYHRTFGEWIRTIRDSGFELLDVLEPTWPDDLTETWGQWSPQRGALFPGTAIFCCQA
ncbi:methyltransferase domain-containing protein [Corynebacterium sp. 153RC1]|uniref:class I SAM-dependent methyltransferase n=1 Tax=unclassified Corynebacterium TaxID=2624378 RepID=UPI00211C6B4C|nr:MULTISPECIES: class I SAM-dependent methyltransferase [unclassified Corynebacterium]MCQ9370958.1 methyltransferase domain-containing protein [Corynebacterium sp. 35RC1]MCQ9353183.1 methyltransferase domain-containing protein [Corynebacterium sp. 209RC1]MCQ9353878.1 methyltransferase domain-containing protein [Corynebacterium sp. 1222RC1]MCQ9356909.1 methyltransferase domain-containing protein [Corynebacterium sp. 122RC1]MCQ9359759.1 methyltransferase domain-containing protein [Corynebacteri